MPIFHLSVRTHSRSAGRSAVAAAAYRAGARLRCERTGRTFDYSRRAGVVATRVVVPRSETTVDRQQLWDRAEAAEKRCNSTVAREIELALPCELDSGAREALALRFAADIAARYGIAVDVAVHEPSKTGDNRNHHAHLLTSTRAWKLDGSFGRKIRQLDDRRTGPAEIVAMRESWAAMCNAALAQAGVADTVDHRSHRERGFPDEPGQKLGPAAVGLERRTGTVSRRRSEQLADRVAREQVILFPLEGKDGAGERRAESDRRQTQRRVLAGLRSKFADATAAAMAGRAHPALGDVLSSAIPQRAPRSATALRGFAARGSTPTMSIRPPPIVPGAPATPAGTRRRKGYDEAEEAAAMVRRVERDLEAEHMVQMAEQSATAKRVASIIDRERLRNAAGIGFGSLPALSGGSIRSRSDSVANGPVWRSIEGQNVDRVIDVQSSPGQDVDDAARRNARAPEVDGLTRRDLAIMTAHELRRRHKRSHARLSLLAGMASLDEAAFAAAVAACDEMTFDPVAIAADPTLAALWDAWSEEDRAKQRAQQGGAETSTPTTVADAVPSATPPVEAEPHPIVPGDVKKTADGDFTAAAVRPYRRRDLVVDYAILVIARGGWSTDVGDALAGLLRTQRAWVWSEAHRVSFKRYKQVRPQDIPGEHLGTINRAVVAGARQHPPVRVVLRAIDRGRIGRDLG